MKTPLREAREKNNLLQLELALSAEIPVRTYQRYESGERIPDVHAAIRMADKLGVKSYEKFKFIFGMKA